MILALFRPSAEVSSMTKKELFISHGTLLAVIIVLALHTGVVAAPKGEALRDTSGQYIFTNPLLDFENTKMAHVSLFSESVEGKVNDLKKKYGIDFASVYFRDLNNGQWIGVNEDEPLASASLVKLPFFLSVFKQGEKDSAVFNKEVKILDSDLTTDLRQNIKPEKEIMPGETYTILQLAEKMIIESDNAAMQALLRVLPGDRSSVYKSVGVKFKEEDDEVMVNVKNYAGFFRVLFNATYLDRENSEMALGILSHVKFTQGIVAGVPQGVAVAHKFGERSTSFNGLEGSRQLHDCGIVYYPENPYILCVMTRGRDLGNQEKFISNVSSYFYNEVRNSLSSTGFIHF